MPCAERCRLFVRSTSSETGMRGNSFRGGRVHVQARLCPTCIFRPGNLMRLDPGRRDEMVASAVAAESAITCHDTLDGDNAVCRGFFDRHATAPLQIATRLGMLVEVDQ
jgi:hypothetical protein